MDQANETTLTVRDDRSDGSGALVRPLMLIERIHQRLQTRRLNRLLDELDQQHGPVPAEKIHNVRRSWPED